MKRNDNDKPYAVGYTLFGLILLIFIGMDWPWQIFLAFGLGILALVEYTGGEDKDRNYLFIAIFIIMAVGIIIGGATYEYGLLALTFLFWGAYEIIEERKIVPSRWDLVGVVAVIISLLLIVTGLMGNTYPELLGLAFAIMSAVQGLKEFFD